MFVQSKLNVSDDKDIETKQSQLHKKVIEQSSQMSQMDKRIAVLKEENELLVS